MKSKIREPYRSMEKRTRDLLVAAYLESGLKETEIAHIFGCSKPLVTRTKHALEGEGALVHRTHVLYAQSSEQEADERRSQLRGLMRCTRLEAQIREAWGWEGEEDSVWVVPA